MEVPACPNCKSDMIVEMSNSAADSLPKRKASTPLSSFMPRVSFINNDSSDVDINKNNEPVEIEPMMHEGKIDKVFKEDAVVYPPQRANKVEIEVEAEVYNAQSVGSQNELTVSVSYQEYIPVHLFPSLNEGIYDWMMAVFCTSLRTLQTYNPHLII